MVEIDADLADNYRQIRAERGLTWAQLAEQHASTDRRLSAWFREQAAAEQPATGRSAAPKGRQANSGREDT